jgi:hypothetical protein
VSKIRLVGRHLGHPETLRRRGDKARQFRRVGAVRVRHADRRDDVGGDADHRVSLEPRRLGHLASILGVEPATVDRGPEPRRVHGEARLDAGQRLGALFDQAGQDRRHLRLVEVVEDAVVGRSWGDVATVGARLDVCRRAPTQERRIDLHRHRIGRVWQRDRLPPAPWMRRHLDAVTEAAQERLNGLLLGGLGRVVGGPACTSCASPSPTRSRPETRRLPSRPSEPSRRPTCACTSGVGSHSRRAGARRCHQVHHVGA